ncbi:hypothetical protein AUJ17_02940 [Candidatus Micrarchaeota archaeon CG1_02_47_40]|nr:MAG: hypothetical protein AUJ17_02940 [Candidatus Micrarchaeota archaeon CG1_02_47_40]
MRFLALADLHASELVLDRLRVILMRRNNYDKILVAGDITNNGPISYAEELIGLVGDKLIAVHGNMDPFPVQQLLEQKGVSAHCKKIKLGEWNVAGLGGSNPTPFGTPTEYKEETIAKYLQAARIDEFSILLSHPPPFGFFDTVGGGVHVGSASVRKAIDEKKPILCICAHVHEHQGKKLHNETTIVKLGPAEHLSAAEIIIEEDIKVNFIRI